MDTTVRIKYSLPPFLSPSHPLSLSFSIFSFRDNIFNFKDVFIWKETLQRWLEGEGEIFYLLVYSKMAATIRGGLADAGNQKL